MTNLEIEKIKNINTVDYKYIMFILTEFKI